MRAAMANIIPFPQQTILNNRPTFPADNLMLSGNETVSFATDYQLKHEKGDWTNQDLAELYRVEAILLQAGIKITTSRGVTDEDDPWFVFCREDGDVFLHLARIDGSYLLCGHGMNQPLFGPNFKSLVRQFVDNNLGETEKDNALSLASPGKYSDVIRLHPLVMFAALAWTLYLSSDQWIAAAQANDSVPQSAFASFASVPNSTISEDPACSDVHGITNLETVSALEQENKNYVKYSHGIFNLFLSIHGIAIGIPLTVSEINFSTVPVPELHKSEKNDAGKIIAEFFDRHTPLNPDLFETHDAYKAYSSPIYQISKYKQPENTANTAIHNPKLVIKPNDAANVYVQDRSDTNSPVRSLYDLGRPQQTGEYSSADSGDAPHGSDVGGPLKIPPDMKNWNGIYKYDNNINTESEYNYIISLLLNVIKHNKNKEIASYLSNLKNVITDGFTGIQKNIPEDLTPASTNSAEHNAFKIDEKNRSEVYIKSMSGTPPVDASSFVATTPAASPAVESAQAPQIAKGQTYGYSISAGAFINYLIGKSLDVKMLQMDREVIIFDVSSIDEPTDKPYMMTWVTESGFNISTIGHIHDYIGFGFS